MQRIESAICAAKKARPYNALITETFDLARRQANKAIQRGITPFPLVVKDCFALAGFPLTCGSKMLEKFVPPYTSTVVQRLIEKGGCIIGKGNMDEFCMGTSSALGYFGPVKSGFSKVENLEEDWRIPGGSSGGPAVAVQLGVADIGIGSDTGGSTRNPASFNGLFGLKPTYGVCSRFGLVPLVNSMDSPSIFAHTAEDCWKTLRIMAGRDENDSTCFDLPERKQISSLKSLRVGLPKEYHNSSLSVAAWCAWNAAANAFERAGAHLLEVSLPSTEYSLLCYHVLSYVDIASNMARNRERFYDHALRVRRKIAYEFQQVFKSVDVLLTPTASDAAPLYSELAESRFEREHSDDFYTQPANLAGVPAISVPFHEKDEDELPVGVQIIGDLLMDRMVIDVAGLLYKELNTVKKERLRYSEQDS